MRSGRWTLSLLAIASSAFSIAAGSGGRGVGQPVAPLDLGAEWRAESDQPNGWLGYSVATAGDVNDDGYADVIAGAYRYDLPGQPDAGIAWAYYGSPTGLHRSADWTGEGESAGAFFGHSVHTAGDVNHDGYDDVIVGAPNPTNGTKKGKVYAFYGSATGLSTTADWMVEGDQEVAWFGRTVRTAGDVNGDGYDDVIVGAPQYDNPEVNEGKAWAYYGSATGLSTTANWTVESDQANSWFGRWVALAGDVNGDGYDDVIVDAHQYDDGQKDEGKAFVYYGSAAGLSTTPAWSAEGNQTRAWFARAVGPAGDVNGDGYADIIIGSPMYDDGQLNEGVAFAYYGSAAGLSTTADWMVESGQKGAMFGRAVWTTGDVNGDGYDDVIVGSPNYDNSGQSDSGRTFAYYGSATGLSTAAYWTVGLTQARAWFGRSVAKAGDVNGDGYDDVIIGAPQFDHGQDDEGAAWTFDGSPAGLG